jgi:rhodanese-related sulfurtransferase
MVIFVYCQGGVRSERASRELVRMGYSNVYDIGGINSWSFGTITD